MIKSQIPNPKSQINPKSQFPKFQTLAFRSLAIGSLVLICHLVFGAWNFSVYAKDVVFEITVDRNKIGVGQPLQLNLTFNGTQDVPALEPPAIEGFQSRYIGPSTRMSIVNGQMSSSITHVYTLLPTKLGVFKIGPFKFEHKGNKYNSNAIQIEVGEAAAQQENPPGQAEQTEAKDLNDRLFFVMEPQKNKVYLNEIIPVSIKLYINKLGVRDIQYPQLNHDGFSVGPFEQPKQYQQVTNGVSYEVIEFNTTVFGLKPGEFRLGPAQLQCNLMVKKQDNRRGPFTFDNFFNADVFDDFFGRYETYPLGLKSTDIPMTVLPLPEEGRPKDFSGTLGTFSFEASVSPPEVKVGDPVTLKAVARGQGNFNTVNLPSVSSSKDYKTYEPQVKQGKEEKSLEQVLIPLDTEIKEVPAVNFTFFNTKTGQYETITQGPFPIRIIKPEKEEELKIVEGKQPTFRSVKEESLGRDIIFIKDTPGRLGRKGAYLYKSKNFLWLQIIPILFYLLAAAVQARRKKLKTDVKYARQLLAPRKAKAGIRRAKIYSDKGAIREFYDAVFETIQEYLGDKFHLPSKAITISIIDEQFKSKNISEETLVKLREIFKACDMVRYAASQFTRENMQDSLRQLEEIIDYFQRNKL